MGLPACIARLTVGHVRAHGVLAADIAGVAAKKLGLLRAALEGYTLFAGVHHLAGGGRGGVVGHVASGAVGRGGAVGVSVRLGAPLEVGGLSAARLTRGLLLARVELTGRTAITVAGGGEVGGGEVGRVSAHLGCTDKPLVAPELRLARALELTGCAGVGVGVAVAPGGGGGVGGTVIARAEAGGQANGEPKSREAPDKGGQGGEASENTGHGCSCGKRI